MRLATNYPAMPCMRSGRPYCRKPPMMNSSSCKCELLNGVKSIDLICHSGTLEGTVGNNIVPLRKGLPCPFEKIEEYHLYS